MRHSSPILERFFNPRHVGSLAAPQGVGVVGTPGEGNFVQMFIAVAEGRIAAARFRSFTCPVAVAACDMVIEMAHGMTLDEARSLAPEAVAQALGGVPEEKMNRCRWAASALQAAVNDFRSRTSPQPSTSSHNLERSVQ